MIPNHFLSSAFKHRFKLDFFPNIIQHIKVNVTFGTHIDKDYSTTPGASSRKYKRITSFDIQ